ncbi:thiol:disulfide interchange protein DsbA/DsbL [soil metagenome]
MNKRLLPALLLSVLLVACGGREAPAPAAADAVSAADDRTLAEPALDGVAAEPALAAGADAQAADDRVPGTTAAPPPAGPTPASPGGPVAGTDYFEITGGQPYAPLQGKVEVVEVFAYWCGACAQFEPLVSAWKARQPSDVRFTHVPAVFSPQDNYPRAFFAAESAGILQRTHGPMFSAIHIERSLRQNASIDDLAAFYGKHGADPGQIKSTMQSFAVEARLNQARQFAVRSGVAPTPTMVVNGKYRIRGRSLEDNLRIAEQLIARERAQASGAR